MTAKTNSIYAVLDPVLHQPIRTRIAAFLAARGETTFSELKQALELTDGNLEAHMKKLTQSSYVDVRKEVDVRQESKRKCTLTFYSLSETGNAALSAYVQALTELLPAPAKSAVDKPSQSRSPLQPGRLVTEG